MKIRIKTDFYFLLGKTLKQGKTLISPITM